MKIRVFTTMAAVCAAIFAGSLLSSCNSPHDDEPTTPVATDGNKEVVTFTLDDQTRATETSFEEGDEIVVIPFEPNPSYLPYEKYWYKYSGGMFIPRNESNRIIKEPNQRLEYLAIYPYYSSRDGDVFIFNNPDNDNCYAYSGITNQSNVKLRFSHSGFRINVTFVGSYSTQVNYVKLTGVVYGMQVNFLSGEITSTEPINGDGIAYMNKVSGTRNQFTYIASPGISFTTETNMLDVYVPNVGHFYYTVPEPENGDYFSFKTGYELNLTLDLGDHVPSRAGEIRAIPLKDMQVRKATDPNVPSIKKLLSNNKL